MAWSGGDGIFVWTGGELKLLEARSAIQVSSRRMKEDEEMFRLLIMASPLGG